MADFKLGRIRFVWKGDWVASTTYYVDDVVRFGGNTYVCVTGHTASLAFGDDNANWNKVTDGQEWKQDWTVDTYYKINDIVKYGGYLYICNEAHQSAATEALGLEDDQAKWDLYTEGFDYQADWQPNTRYKINDIVKYNSTVYLCTEGHTSAADSLTGLEADQDKWDIFTLGVSWQSDWQANQRYVVNDIIRYGGRTYLCNTGHVSAATATIGLEADQAKWDIFHDGVEYKGDWAPGTRYKLNDLVKFGGGIWICVTYHTSQAYLTDDEAKWEQFTEGLEFEDSWSGTRRYQAGDFVTYGGYSYVAITNNLGQRPTDNPTDWDLFTTGFRLVGDWGEDSSNYEYFVGDVVRQGGYTYLCILDHTGQEPPNTTYWERLNQGIEWNDAWTDATEYDLGDAVRYGSSSYIAVQKHTSDETITQNRPDQDVAGAYWNLLSGGGETLPMTTEGDMVYYGGAGPARLAIGDAGQTLRVNAAGDAPEWSFFGRINNVWYVSTDNGVDSPAPNYGTTLDQPWATVRYSLEQIEKGALYPNAKYLLERNRAFIQAEIVEWTDYQIANDIAPFTSAFTYDKDLCRRDMGLLVDAIVYDLSHGGNEKTREATEAYFSSGGVSYITGQEAETVASINYGLSLIDAAILQSVDPATNYQTENGVGSPITQIKDLANYPEETGAQTRIDALVPIITDAITAGDTDDMPALVIPNNTLFVKTGTYTEVLPMIVPQQTAVVGDELRSTRITPAASLVDSGDTAYSLAGINRLKAIVSDIITNSAVSKTTTGANPNTETQVTSRPAGSAGASAPVTSISALADEIIDILENGTGNADALTFTDTGVTAKTTARTELQANRSNIVTDLTNWIDNEINDGPGSSGDAIWDGFTYDSAACARDTGYIVDALSYDIQYGTNWATNIMARAYYSGTVVIAGETDQTSAAFTQLKTIVTNYMSGATEEAEAGSRIDEIIDVIDNGLGSLTTISYPDYSWGDADEIAAADEVISRKTEIQTHTVSHVQVTNETLNFDTDICYRDAGYIVDALAYDLALGSNFQSVFAGLRYYSSVASAQLVISEQLSATVDAVKFIQQKVNHIAGAGAGQRAIQLLQDMYDYIDFDVNSTGTAPYKHGTTLPEKLTGYTYAVDVLEANRAFLVAEVNAFIAATYPAYSYDTDACARDVNAYIDALKYDIVWTGNYKSILAARYYSNAVNGSTTEDMFYMRNGTGLRNCTVADLNGTLTAANSYGTRRPTAGAYVSLDPGWGPDDDRAWITAKSPYVQNVTTFGTGCVGLKVDGDLHAGGNDSIVANDFTQILSDGIGAWVTNLGRSELVSVFSYYNHIGYLAENGGKIRATNGNNSYGDFGSVSEGIDDTEVPVTADVDNQKLDAIVDSVMTDGDDILVLNYLNAGVNYTAGATTISITGEGYGLGTVTPTTVNGGVFEVRMLDTDVDGDSTLDTGGADYAGATNSAQEGDTTTITISNTDTAQSSQYVGMAIYLTAGTGAGQYGYIGSYNAGTKIAQVYKMSDDSPGWDHVIGSSIVSALDATTEYSIEPRITFSSPASGLYADTAKGRAIVADEQIARIVIWDPGSGYASAPTLTITDPNNTIEAPTEVRIGDGVLAQPIFSDRGTDFATASAEVVGDGYADRYQPGEFMEVENLSEEPQPGSNVVFAHLPDKVFKLVAVRDFQGAGPYSAQLQISPELAISEAPDHGESLEMRIRYSQVRLTGHDFLDIGTGNATETNYPNAPLYDPDSEKETTENGGGRVFFTSTDQDGNFRVGDLFSVEQSTGIATLNADAFNISGLQELSLGELGLGSTGAVINEFSTDGTFTANSDNIVPTQKAIKTYITSQIGGGAATLNVNSVTAGQIQISGQEITTTLGTKIDVLNVMNFEKGVNGVPVAMNYFLS